MGQYILLFQWKLFTYFVVAFYNDVLKKKKNLHKSSWADQDYWID